MKTFNRVIQVEVAVDTIAKGLLDTMIDTNPHREMIVESIIGGANTFQLGLLYNALNGFTNEINFQVGDFVVPNEVKVYGHWQGIDNPQTYEFIQEAEIVEIDVYSKEKLKIKYSWPNSNGGHEPRTQWINHIGCTLIEDLKKVLDELAN